MDPLFTLPPDDLTGMEDTDLAELAAGLRDRVREIHEGRRNPEVVGDRTQSQVADEMQAAVLAIEAIDAELTARAEQDSRYDTDLDELASRVGVRSETTEGGDGGEGEGDDGGDDGEGDGEPEATTAAADEPEKPAPAAPAQTRPLPAARRHRPVVQPTDDGTGLRVTSHAAGLGAPYDAMTVLDRVGMGHFLTDIVRRNRVQPGQKAVIAHASYAFPHDRILEDGPDGHYINSERIRDVVGAQALLASGGLCAPLTPIYTLPGVETPARPVRAAQASFQAARGGVQVGVTPKMGDYADAVGVVTDAENTAGGTLAVKACMRIECPDFNPTTVDSIYQCIEADNLAARAYPELMARISDLVLAEQARLADSKLLTAIKAASTQVTNGSVAFGAMFEFLGGVYEAASGIRSRNRMPEGARLQALIPAWLVDALALDVSRGAFDRFQTRDQITGILSNAGITPYYYLDGPSDGTGQVFGAQSPGALDEFPADVQWCIYPAGTFLHLDAGELQLGVVRDSSLNSTNDFQIFAETWENIAMVGVESLWVTTTLCPSGSVAAGADVSSLCGT